MPKNLAQRQKDKTRRELERDLKVRDRKKLAMLRDAIKAAKRTRRDRLRGVTAQCREARRANTERAKRARERLRQSIARTREKARTICTVSRGEVSAETLREIERAVEALAAERGLQRQLRAWTKPTSCSVPKARKGERRMESDCEVSANLDDPGLRVVWNHVKGRIKGTAHKSRTEAFLEWAHEHTADVYAIQERDAEEALDALEREERRLSSEVKKAGRYRSKSPRELAHMLEAVPF